MAIAASAGMPHEEIAIALGISRTTLSKHFEIELSRGAYEKRLERLEVMHKAAKKGNVAAARYCDQQQPQLAAPPAEVMGKKDQASADAKVAQEGTEWAALLKRPNAVQ